VLGFILLYPLPWGTSQLVRASLTITSLYKSTCLFIHKWPILCQVWRKTTTQSINQLQY